MHNAIETQFDQLGAGMRFSHRDKFTISLMKTIITLTTELNTCKTAES